MAVIYDTHILAFWPHPDDVEIGAWWLLVKSTQSGKKSMIIDLTCSHLSTRGTPEQRLQESQHAAAILWVQRLNLWLDDLSLNPDEHHRNIIARYIRQYRPEIVLLPYHTDRHPDHEATSRIVKQALFVAGLAKIDLWWLATHRPRIAAMYQIRNDDPVDVIVTLNESEYQIKHDAFRSYDSQNETNHRARQYFDGRSKVLWWKVWSPYGEWYVICESQIGITSLDDVHTRAL